MAGFDSDGNLHCSANSLKNVSNCSTLAWLTINGYASKSEAAELLAGSAVHTAMEVYFRTWSKLQALEAFSNEYKEWADKTLDSFHRLTHSNVRTVLAHWFEQRPKEKIPYVPYPGLIEQELVVPLIGDDPKLLYVLRPDLVCFVGKTSAVGIVDHKTGKSINTYFKDQYKLDAQVTSYWWAIEKILDTAVTVFYINAIGLPKLADADNRKRCTVHNTYIGKCSVLHAPSSIFSYSRTPALIAEWHRNAVIQARHLEKILTIAPDISHLKKIRMNGMMRGHCKFCPKSEFCAAGRPVNAIRDFMVEPIEAIKKAA